MDEKGKEIMKIAWAAGCFAAAFVLGCLVGDREFKEQQFIEKLEEQLEERDRREL